jgi:hypothetical protein
VFCFVVLDVCCIQLKYMLLFCRFRVKIQFSDGTGAVPFSLSDSSVYHLIRKHCSDFMDNCQVCVRLRFFSCG